MDAVVQYIVNILKSYEIEKAVLFGSRARGDHAEVSDYDIAVFEQTLRDIDRAVIRDEMDDIPTLKKIDIVFIRESGTDELIEDINRDGVVIYEQA